MESKTKDAAEEILRILRKGPATPDEVAKEIGAAWATAQGRLMKLVADGTLVSVRKGKVNIYFLKYPASISPKTFPWAKVRDLKQLSSELEQYFPDDITAAEMIERERRRS